MATENFIVTSLPEYVQNNREVLVNKFGLLGGGTRQRISIQTGVKGKAALNYLAMDVVLQDGAECAFTPEGSAELTQREIETAPIKVDMEFCPRKLAGKYAEYLIRMNAVEEGNKLPFEEYIVDYIVDSINDKIEKLIWMGDTESLDNNRKWINGFIKIITAAETGAVQAPSGESVYETCLNVYMAMPEAILDKNPEIYVAPAKFRQLMQELIEKNWYHYPVGTPQDEIILPGTDVKVVKTAGLAGTGDYVGTFAKNLYYGTDMEGDEETIDLWYSKDDRMFKLEVLWNCGVQVAFPNMVVYART